MKESLLITSTDLMMVQFLVPHVKHLSKQGYIIDIACSNVGGRFQEIKELLSPYVREIYELKLKRSPFVVSNYIGYNQLKKILSNHFYDLIWTNEPVIGVITRLAARKFRRIGTVVLYMTHGFHFYNGAPIINWLLYYPIERLMSKFTDVICTINTEDFYRANKFHTSQIKYIHGIGFNQQRLSLPSKRNDIRKELGLKVDDFIVLSIGELNDNKNHRTIIKALAHIRIPGLHYIICGKGPNKSRLKLLTKKMGLDNNIHFLGYRKDVVDICSQSDIYVMPSLREGLGISVLEAMFCGLPLVTSNIGGLRDVNKNSINGFQCPPKDYIAFAEKIEFLLNHPEICKKMGKQNKIDVVPFKIDNTLIEVKNIISSL